MTTDKRYADLMEKILMEGQPIKRRGMDSLEILGNSTTWNMQYPIISLKERRLNYQFMFAEALWILRGQKSLDEISPYCGRIQKFSDDGRYLSGAYGPPFIEQRRYVVDCLDADIMTRQAVMTFWRPSPRESKDIPCTLALQFIVTDMDGGPQLNLIASMRSSDAFLGIPYDVFSFSMIAYHVLLSLKMTRPIHLGWLSIMAGSQHIYKSDLALVSNVLSNRSESREYTPITSYYVHTPVSLENTLSTLRDNPKILWME